MSGITAVILGAGRASRMGGEKLLVPFGAGRLIDRVFAATAAYPTLAVLTGSVAQVLVPPAHVRVVVNDDPERGMAHSLQLADRLAVPGDALLVFLADMPFVDSALAQQIAESATANGADVCFPHRGAVGGHPVWFSAAARRGIAALRGDALRRLRDDGTLHRVRVPIDDDAPYVDVDDERTLREALAMLGATGEHPPLV